MDISKYLEDLKNGIKDVSSELSPGNQKILSLAGNEKKIGELIDSINDDKKSYDDKQEVLHLLQTISVFSPVLPTKMPEFVNALRGLTNVDHSGLRLQAFGSLASMKDEFVQEKLLEILKSDTKEEDRSVPTHNAIAMLGFDEKAVDQGILKKIIQQPPNPESLVQALRHLDADQDALKLLKGVMEDTSLPIEARSLVPELIHQVNPAEFLDSAKRIIEKQGAGADIIPFLARALPQAGKEAGEVKNILKNLIDDVSPDAKNLLNDLFSSDDDE